MRVYPKPGIRVRDPAKRDFLPDGGREVGDFDLYWRRRLKDGDVTTEKPAAASASTALVVEHPTRSDDA